MAILFVQYVKVNPPVEPAVTADAVKSIVLGEQTAVGLVVETVGKPFIVKSAAVLLVPPRN